MVVVTDIRQGSCKYESFLTFEEVLLGLHPGHYGVRVCFAQLVQGRGFNSEALANECAFDTGLRSTAFVF